jgi:hypothetical protein
VKGIGRASPVPLNTVTVIIRVAVDGNGSDKYINGSKVTEILLQTGHTSVDLYWPCNINKQIDRLKHKTQQELTNEHNKPIIKLIVSIAIAKALTKKHISMKGTYLVETNLFVQTMETSI